MELCQSVSARPRSPLREHIGLIIHPSPFPSLALSSLHLSSLDSFKRTDEDAPLAAEQSGIEVGDELLAVNGTPLAGLPLHEVIEAVRGVVLSNLGSAIVLTLRQPDKEEENDELRRQQLQQSTSSLPLRTRLSSCSPTQAVASIETAKVGLDNSRDWKWLATLPLPSQCGAADVCVCDGQVVVALVAGTQIELALIVAEGGEGSLATLKTQNRAPLPEAMQAPLQAQPLLLHELLAQ
jgi:hypothetical protein